MHLFLSFEHLDGPTCRSPTARRARRRRSPQRHVELTIPVCCQASIGSAALPAGEDAVANPRALGASFVGLDRCRGSAARRRHAGLSDRASSERRTRGPRRPSRVPPAAGRDRRRERRARGRRSRDRGDRGPPIPGRVPGRAGQALPLPQEARPGVDLQGQDGVAAEDDPVARPDVRDVPRGVARRVDPLPTFHARDRAIGRERVRRSRPGSSRPASPRVGGGRWRASRAGSAIGPSARRTSPWRRSRRWRVGSSAGCAKTGQPHASRQLAGRPVVIGVGVGQEDGRGRRARVPAATARPPGSAARRSPSRHRPGSTTTRHGPGRRWSACDPTARGGTRPARSPSRLVSVALGDARVAASTVPSERSRMPAASGVATGGHHDGPDRRQRPGSRQDPDPLHGRSVPARRPHVRGERPLGRRSAILGAAAGVRGLRAARPLATPAGGLVVTGRSQARVKPTGRPASRTRPADEEQHGRGHDEGDVAPRSVGLKSGSPPSAQSHGETHAHASRTALNGSSAATR